MNLVVESYELQKKRWPTTGRYILAHFDEQSVVVYQAYRPSIGRFAVANQHFGGDFSFQRMSWIKPNFLWMMYRCGWGQKQDQEMILAIRLRRAAFDEILLRAVHSSYAAEVYADQAEWKASVAASDVRLQWDPDHAPNGEPLERRAIQLGLRGETLVKFSHEWLIGIEDITPFVAEQSRNLKDHSRLLIPREDVYPVKDSLTARKLGVQCA
jgi:hypothetical protein